MEDRLVVAGKNDKLDSEDDVGDIISQIDSFENLEVLKLSGNSYGKDAAKAIGNALTKHRGLKRALWSDMFVSRLKNEIPEALTHLGNGLISAGAQLVELDISDNALGPTGLEGLKVLLTSPVCFTMKTLRINNTGLGIGGGKMLSRALLDCHQEAADSGGKFCLEVFEAGRNRLENEGATALAAVFETLGSLVELSLPQNGIYHEGITELAHAMGKNVSLEVLNLNDNTLTEKGSEAVAAVLPDLQDIRIIDLGECIVRSDGAMVLAKALENGHKKLERLLLSFNELDVDSAIEVAIAMEHKSELKLLDLNGNGFSRDEIEIITETLQAKGHSEEVLGSFSDDEEDSEEEDPTNENEEEQQQQQSPGDSPQSTNSNRQSDESGSMRSKRTDLIELVNSLGDSPSTEEVTQAFIQGCSTYSVTCTDEDRNLLHNFIEDCCRSVCESGQTNQLINDILVHTGQIKSEDKKFKPVDNIHGPLLGLAFLSKQQYFPAQSKDILVHFFQRPNKSLDNIRHTLLSLLYC